MSRSHYWSCSKFADWVRGTRKLEAGTSEQWDDWKKRAQGYNPVRYWIAEEGLDYLATVVYFIPDTLYDIKYYINNRWVTKTHALTASPRDIQRGSWRDVGDRFLPCLFNELVDFVEVELAWWNIVWSDDAAKEFKAPWYSRGWARWRTWRSPASGLANLDWQSKLVYDDGMGIEPGHKLYGTPTTQAEKAQEILDLYLWWTKVRPARPDPYEASGWSEYCRLCGERPGGIFSSISQDDPELKKMSKKAHKLLDKMEADFEKEDTDMMIRLIKVRHGLWT